MDALDMAVVDLRELPVADQDQLRALVERAEAARAHPPLPEPQLRAAMHVTEALEGERIVLARRDADLVACAVLSPGRDGSTVLHVVVDPAPAVTAAAPDLATIVLDRALQDVPADTRVHLWVMQATTADDARAEAAGFEAERDLLQMRVTLPLPQAVLEATRPLATRPFVPDQDEAAWVETNNRAFEGHPEQGAWTVAELRERMTADWVDLDGFLLADDPDGPGLIGACWTKVHRDHTPVLGEIYVIDVDPRQHGQGWGRSLTVAGLVHLAGLGITVGMLYTDASNVAAVALYRSLGFTVDHIDRSYLRPPSQ